MPDAEYVVLQTRDLRNGEMKQVKAGTVDVLVACVDGEFFATGAHCPHYGAALADGLLCGHRLTCPWHKAAFDVTTGRLMDPPALDHLPYYCVRVDGTKVVVTVPAGKQEDHSSAHTKSSKSRPNFVLLGAGAAGIAAAQELRALGFDGNITLVSHERETPYDRTKLSKEFLSGNAGEEDLPSRTEDFYSTLAIERVTGHVTEVVAGSRNLELEDGRTLAFDSLLIATGGIPRSLEVPGAGLGNVFLLRTVADARKIQEAIRPGVRTVVIGGSFIGLEVASCFALRKLPVMVIVPEKAPFAQNFGAEVGRAFGQWHEQHGVEFRLGMSVERISGTGVVREVILQSGERIPADVVVIGGGVRPATGMLRGFAVRDDGGLEVDEYLQAAQDIYAAGDIAVFPDSYSQRKLRIEHWRVAEQQGRTAAANMLGRKQPFRSVPYFWTNHFGTRFDYVGHAEEWDEVIMKGDTGKPEFIAYYVENGKITAASACGRDREIIALEELFRQRRAPSPDEVRAGVDLIALAKQSTQAA